MMTKYRISLAYSPEDEGYIAVVPELDGCSAFGETASEAVDEVQMAIEAWLEAARAAGNPIPEPSQRVSEERRSGKLLLRLGPSLHTTVAELAEIEGQSVNSYIVNAIYLKVGLDTGKTLAESSRALAQGLVAVGSAGQYSLFKGSSSSENVSLHLSPSQPSNVVGSVGSGSAYQSVKSISYEH